MGDPLIELAIVSGIVGLGWFMKHSHQESNEVKKYTTQDAISRHSISLYQITNAAAPTVSGKASLVHDLNSAKDAPKSYVTKIQPSQMINRNQPIDKVVNDVQREAGRLYNDRRNKTTQLLMTNNRRGLPVSNDHQKQLMMAPRNTSFSRPKTIETPIPSTKHRLPPRKSQQISPVEVRPGGSFGKHQLVPAK